MTGQGSSECPAPHGFEAEIAALKRSVDAMAERIDARLCSLERMQERLDHSEQMRRDLADQMEHLLELLSESRKELAVLRKHFN